MMVTRQESKMARAQTYVVILLVLFSLMSYFDRTIMAIAGPSIMKEFRLSEVELGAVFTAFQASYALMMMPGGHWADRFGPHTMLTIMGFGAAVFTGLTALGGKPGLGAYLGIIPSFIAIRLGLGVFTAPLYPSCARAYANWIPPGKRARVQGFVTAGVGLGSGVSPVLFSWMSSIYGWRLSFCMAAIATAGLALVWLWYFRDHPAENPALGAERASFVAEAIVAVPTDKTESTPWRRLLTNRNLMLLSLSYFTVSYFEYIFFFWIYYYLGEIRHLGPQQSPIATSFVFLTWMVMSPLGGWVSDRLVARWGDKTGLRLVPVVSLTLGAILLCIGINLKGTFPAVALLCLSFGFTSCSDGSYWAAAIRLGGRQVGAACSILNTGSNLGGIGPYIAPLIAMHAGWSWGLYSASMILMLGVVTWVFVDPTKSITAA